MTTSLNVLSVTKISPVFCCQRVRKSALPFPAPALGDRRRVGLSFVVVFADGAGRNLAGGVVPPVLPAGAQLDTFLGKMQGHVEIGVVTPGVVGLAGHPVRKVHLPHAGAAAARAARRRLPDERRQRVACDVVALTGRPEHRLARVRRVASTLRQIGFCRSQLCAVDRRRPANSK